MSELISPTFNLAVLIAVLVYYLKGPVQDFISNRHHSVRQEIDRVAALLRQATDQDAELTAKLKAIGAELLAIREQAQQEAQAAQNRIAAEAQKLAQTLVADARIASEALYFDLKGRLSVEMGSRIIERAEQLLRERLTGDDRVRIRQEFSSQVEAAQ